MLDLLKEPVLAVQEFLRPAPDRALKNIFRRPHYGDDIFLQMDAIGVGSLPIVVMTGFFSGAVMALQMSRALSQYGAGRQDGHAGLADAGARTRTGADGAWWRAATPSGIASELGSMKVTEQIDAMRALGTDPIQKLVTPRLIATGVDAAAADDHRGFRGHVRRLHHRHTCC